MMVEFKKQKVQQPICLKYEDRVRALWAENQQLKSSLQEIMTNLCINPIIRKTFEIGFWDLHYIDLVIRHNGEDKRYEADWLSNICSILRKIFIVTNPITKASTVYSRAIEIAEWVDKNDLCELIDSPYSDTVQKLIEKYKEAKEALGAGKEIE